MTAIIKTKNIHGTNLIPLLDYGSNQEKTSYIDNALQDTLDYASNPLKTVLLEKGEVELLVTGIKCKPESAAQEFSLIRERYLLISGKEEGRKYEFFDKRTGKTQIAQPEPITAIHLIQSFEETDLDPHLVHQIGIDLCNRLGVMAVVDTHMNKEHLHNHIIINAYMNDKSKFSLNKNRMLEIRELSDELQREYGIPIRFLDPRHQLEQSKGHSTYGEWKAKKEHISWKDQMRDEMVLIRSVCDDREEFIALMQDYGYEIARQEQDSIVWWNKEHTRKIRDTTLGMEYNLYALFPDEESEIIYRVGHEETHKAKSHHTISIARYDWNGRRRSDLVLLIRKTIALLNHLMNQPSRTPHVLTQRSISNKITLMEDTLETVVSKGYETRESLAERMDAVGAKLNHTKSKLRELEGQKTYNDALTPKLRTYLSLKDMMDHVSYWPGGLAPDLFLPEVSADTVLANQSLLSPMSKSQKKELYLTLKEHADYSLKDGGFDSISSVEADHIIAFLNGKESNKPESLLTYSQVSANRIYNKRNEAMKKKLTKPIAAYQRNEVEKLLKAHGLTANIDKLTQYDVINIRNCLSPNPFAEQPIAQAAQKYLKERLQSQGYTLNRQIEYVLPAEYTQILDYLDGFIKSKPPLLKESVPLSTESIDSLKMLMLEKGISSSIPVEAMTKADYDKMFGYVLAQGHLPDCAFTPATDQAEQFIQTLDKANLTDDKKLLVLQYRNSIVELLELGIASSEVQGLLDQIHKFEKNYALLESERDTYSKEYRELVTLEKHLSYAESPSFIYGDLWEKKEKDAPKIIEVEKRDTKDEKNPKQPDVNPDL